MQATPPETEGYARYVNWTVLGPAFLTLLFVAPGASLDVTEALSSRKYIHCEQRPPPPPSNPLRC